MALVNVIYNNDTYELSYEILNQDKKNLYSYCMDGVQIKSL